jgi:hypothetical protein
MARAAVLGRLNWRLGKVAVNPNGSAEIVARLDNG